MGGLGHLAQRPGTTLAEHSPQSRPGTVREREGDIKPTPAPRGVGELGHPAGGTDLTFPKARVVAPATPHLVGSYQLIFSQL